MSVTAKVVLMVTGVFLGGFTWCLKLDAFTYEAWWLHRKRYLVAFAAIRLAMLAASVAMMAWAVFS